MMRIDLTTSRYLRFVFAIAAIMLSSLFVYIASYIALVECVVLQATDLSMTHHDTIEVPIARYRLGGRFSETIFRPAQRVDERVRPEKWRVRTIEHPLPWDNQ